MINHAWTVVCQKSITDKETNNISLDVLEQLNVQFPPIPQESKGIIFPIHIEIISLWYRAQESEGIKDIGRLRIESTNKEEMGTINVDIDLTQNYRFRSRALLDGLPIPKNISGNFNFITELKQNGQWVQVSCVPLEIKLKTTQF